MADYPLDPALSAAIISSARDAIISIDRGGLITSFNPAATDIFGYAIDEVLGRNVSMLMPAPYRDEHDAYLANYHRTGERRIIGRIRHVQARHKSGRMFPVELGVTEAQVDGEAAYCAIIRDVERAQRRYRAVVDQAAVIVLVLTPEGRVVEFNPEAERAYGWTRAEAIEKDYYETCLPERERARVREAAGRVLAGEVVRGFENAILRSDGSERVVLWNSVRLADGHGISTGLVAVGTDITERKLAAEALEAAHGDLQNAHRRLSEEQAKIVQAEKLSSIGQLASGVAHEVNNPLAGIMSCVETLRSRSFDGERRDAYFDAIEDGLGRIERIVRALLDYARPRGHDASQAVDLREVVDACLILVRPRQQKANVQVDVACEPGDFVVRGERYGLMQAVMNVLLNAIDVAPEHSTVEVTCHSDSTEAELRVRDRGPGIPAHDLARVTDPFFTTKPEGEGTGLGLAVTQGIIARHRGELRIESTPGEGTTVTFVLPAA